MRFSIGGLAIVLAGVLALVAAAPAPAGEPVVARSDFVHAAFDKFAVVHGERSCFVWHNCLR